MSSFFDPFTLSLLLIAVVGGGAIAAACLKR